MKKSSKSSSRVSLKMSTLDEGTELHRPIPRRSFILGSPDSNEPSASSTPVSPEFSRDGMDHLLPPANGNAGSGTPGDMTPDTFRRTLSVKNLTASALSAIYGSAYDNVPPTPGLLTRRNSGTDLTGVPEGTFANQHSRPLNSISSFSKGANQYRVRRRRKGQTMQTVVSAVVRTVLLFISGAAYGIVIARLHDNGRIVPVSVDIERNRPQYLIIWGLAGVALGSLLPWVDFLWEEYVLETQGDQDMQYRAEKKRASIDAAVEVMNSGVNGINTKDGVYDDESEDGAPTWNPVIRSIGAFVGIAYAIRKLPWQSTMQASLTLSLVNPALWYLIDRSRTGFWLSSFVGIVGTVFLVGLNPDFVKPASTGGVSPAATAPSAAPINSFGSHLDFTVMGYPADDAIPVATWIASVLFCSCVCFGNIGRKLASRRKERELEWVTS